VMTLALLVYSVAQRRLRAQLAKYHATGARSQLSGWHVK
jgi:hypothetical protein